MARIAEFDVKPVDFSLSAVFEEHPDATIELERIVPTHQALIPYFWVRGVESEKVLSSFRASSEVKAIDQIDKVNGDVLVRIEWGHDTNGLLHAVADSEVTLLSAEGSNEGWTFEVRTEDPAELRDFQDRCRENEIPVQLKNLHALTPLRSKRDHSLTETQHEALILAYEQGYYDSPQQVTLEEMANELGITGQSFGSRLRRGSKRLIGSTLIETE